ncbi:MAG: aminotransferase class IV [Pseudomonadota bacterium]
MTDFSKGAAWQGGRIMPIHEAKIGVTDWGLTHSDITYDVVPIREGAFFRLPDYLERFHQSMESLRLDVGMNSAEIRSALHAMVAASGLHDSYCSMVASRGVPTIPGSRDPRDCANHFYAWCVPFIYVFKPDVVERGAKLQIGATRRIPDDSVDPRAKNYHWGDFTPSLIDAKETGFDNTLLLDHQGRVTEGPGFNIFAVFGDHIVTPEWGCLEGITRRTVLEIAAVEGLIPEIRDLPVAKFMQADEVFTSTSGGGIAPVVQVDDRVFSNGAPGQITQRLATAYLAWTGREDLIERVSYGD